MSYIGNQPTSVAFLTDTFNGNGSTTVFTMSVAPASTSSILVAVTGVVQDPSTYAVSGTTLTFSEAPPSGTGNISVRYLGIPASGVATTAYRTVTEFTATAGQTTFSVPSYTVGFIDVYRNGVMLGSADYTATSGTTVVLAIGATAGDLIETISFYVSSVLNAIPATTGAVSSGYITDNAIETAKIADDAVTPAKLSQPLTSDTAVASTSGTSIDFTGIPSWVKRITVMFSGVSLSGTSDLLIQVGDSGGFETSGYLSTSSAMASGGTGISTSTIGFVIRSASGASISSGVMALVTLGSNLWVSSYSGKQSSTVAVVNGGDKTLSDTLDRVRITTVNGTNTFDAGSINIMWE